MIDRKLEEELVACLLDESDMKIMDVSRSFKGIGLRERRIL
jgi:hypothetical protein